jgi:hypothetical protein
VGERTSPKITTDAGATTGCYRLFAAKITTPTPSEAKPRSISPKLDPRLIPELPVPVLGGPGVTATADRSPATTPADVGVAVAVGTLPADGADGVGEGAAAVGNGRVGLGDGAAVVGVGVGVSCTPQVVQSPARLKFSKTTFAVCPPAVAVTATEVGATATKPALESTFSETV